LGRPKITMHKEKKLKLKSGLKLTKFEYFSRILTWLERYFSAGYLVNCKRILQKMFRILETRGKAEGIKYAKQTRLGLLKALEGHSKKELCTKIRNGIKFPKDLRFLKLVQSERFYPVIRLVLSTLSVFRFLKGDGKPSFSTIEQGPSLARIPTDLLEYILPFFRSMGYRPLGLRSRKLDFKKFRMTVKAGPKGHALWTSYLDLLHMPDSLRESIGVVGGKKLREYMSTYLDLIPSIADYLTNVLECTSMSFRRLSIIQDKEGKNREIAILDYYSQAALQPLHDYLFKLLKRIPQDSTFDQSGNLEKLVPSDGSSYHSIDLSSATDRFPIAVQFALIETLFGTEYAVHWQNMMVGYPFDFGERKVIYARGNPMGAYSSWSAFVLAHHFLVFIACKQGGVDWKGCPYILLGDDIVIANDLVAENYKSLLQRLDIPFSKEKSHRSPYLFEFAKRFVHDGTEISPFPLAGLYENRNNWLLAVGTIFEEIHRKRWNPVHDILQLSVGYLQAIGYNRKFISRHSMNLELILLIRHSFAGRRPMAPVLHRAAFLMHGQEFYDLITWFPAEFIEPQVMIKSFQKLFRKSVDRMISKCERTQLGTLPREIIDILFNECLDAEDPFLLIESCPIFQTFQEIEQTFVDLRKGKMNDDALIRKDYRHFLMEVSIPTSDLSFYLRRKDAVQLVTSQLVDQILVTLEEGRKNPQLFHPFCY
jgi:hypothetical protein